MSRHLALVSGNAHPALAEELARELSIPLTPAEIRAFADGEARVQILGDVAGQTVVIVQPTCPSVDEHLMALALLADAARAASAARIVAVVPYFGYARQDQRGHLGEARSAQVAARLLAAVEIDHLVTLDLHSPALESAFLMPTTLLQADEAFLPVVRGWATRDLTVVSPDAGGLKRAQRYALALGTPLAVIAKHRHSADVATVTQLVGDVRGRDCLVIDDMASTGRTLVAAAEALKRGGAEHIFAAVTHAVMSPGAIERLLSAPLDRLATTDSVPPPQHGRIEIVRIAPLLAGAISRLGG